MSKDYDVRKIQSENISREYLGYFQTFEYHERKHDMSDAMLMILYYYKKIIKPKCKNIVDDHFEQFKFCLKI
jgi:hypothetical protein